MLGTKKAVDEGDDCPSGEFHEEFEDPIEEQKGIALVQGIPAFGRVLPYGED
jgi:hypothetical protein